MNRIKQINDLRNKIRALQMSEDQTQFLAQLQEQAEFVGAISAEECARMPEVSLEKFNDELIEDYPDHSLVVFKTPWAWLFYVTEPVDIASLPLVKEC